MVLYSLLTGFPSPTRGRNLEFLCSLLLSSKFLEQSLPSTGNWTNSRNERRMKTWHRMNVWNFFLGYKVKNKILSWLREGLRGRGIDEILYWGFAMWGFILLERALQEKAGKSVLQGSKSSRQEQFKIYSAVQVLVLIPLWPLPE